MTTATDPALFAAINKTDRLGTPIWTAEKTPADALAKAEQEAGLDPGTLEVVPVGPRLAYLLDTGRYAPETRWEVVDGVAELCAEEITAAAKADAVAFYDEFGEALDPDATDWDAVAWEVSAEGLGLSERDAALAFAVYQEALVRLFTK